MANVPELGSLHFVDILSFTPWGSGDCDKHGFALAVILDELNGIVITGSSKSCDVLLRLCVTITGRGSLDARHCKYRSED